MRITQICIFISMAHLALFAAAPARAAEVPTEVGTPSQRIARLATEARERWLDLSPVSETMGAGAGLRQDRLELTFTETHRERQREHNRWVLRELDAIPFDALNLSEKLTHQLLIFGLEALLAHEGMPGHHFDGGLKLESDLPDFRRRSFVNAFGEGWGLYAESLGHELGLYDTPLALMGRYSYELFRACQLVVDTGLHAKDWPRERAITYLVDECGSSPEGATSEVLRYMAWPGQALGYKIGELALLDIRANAEKRLGKRFDIHAFHDALLAEGHLPLTLARMAAWVEEQAKKV